MSPPNTTPEAKETLALLRAMRASVATAAAPLAILVATGVKTTGGKRKGKGEQWDNHGAWLQVVDESN